MKWLRAGAVLLSIWCGLNAAVALYVTVMTVSGHAAPALALVLRPSEVGAADPRLLAVVNAQAAMANPCIIALCGLVLAVTWTSVMARARWALRALIPTLVPLQAFGFVSDGFLHDRNLAANVGSTVVLITALALIWQGRRAAARGGAAA
jgi:hypothetical protein